MQANVCGGVCEISVSLSFGVGARTLGASKGSCGPANTQAPPYSFLFKLAMENDNLPHPKVENKMAAVTIQFSKNDTINIW